MEAEERALAGGGASPPREGERVVAARTDVSMGTRDSIGRGEQGRRAGAH